MTGLFSRSNKLTIFSSIPFELCVTDCICPQFPSVLLDLHLKGAWWMLAFRPLVVWVPGKNLCFPFFFAINTTESRPETARNLECNPNIVHFVHQQDVLLHFCQ